MTIGAFLRVGSGLTRIQCVVWRYRLTISVRRPNKPYRLSVAFARELNKTGLGARDAPPPWTSSPPIEVTLPRALTSHLDSPRPASKRLSGDGSPH